MRREIMSERTRQYLERHTMDDEFITSWLERTQCMFKYFDKESGLTSDETEVFLVRVFNESCIEEEFYFPSLEACKKIAHLISRDLQSCMIMGGVLGWKIDIHAVGSNLELLYQLTNSATGTY